MTVAEANVHPASRIQTTASVTGLIIINDDDDGEDDSDDKVDAIEHPFRAYALQMRV